VSWVEEARQEVQRQEASRACETSMEDPFVSAGFATVTEEAANQEDWGSGICLGHRGSSQ
jgi:hypothetical protein